MSITQFFSRIFKKGESSKTQSQEAVVNTQDTVVTDTAVAPGTVEAEEGETGKELPSMSQVDENNPPKWESQK